MTSAQASTELVNLKRLTYELMTKCGTIPNKAQRDRCCAEIANAYTHLDKAQEVCNRK